MTKDEALKKIATVNAMDYEYQAWARQALANEALERKAENARELGLDYEPDKNEFKPDWDEKLALTEEVIRLSKRIEELEAQPEPWEKFCDSNCVWTDHHPDCKLAERKPLTDEELFKLWVSVPAETEDRFAFARAIEAAHGIKGEA